MIQIPSYVPYLIAVAGILAGILLHLAAILWMTHRATRLTGDDSGRTCDVCDQPVYGTVESMRDGSRAALCKEHLEQSLEFHQRQEDGLS